MPALSPKAQELFALQRAKYLRSLPGKKARISRCWKELLRQGWAPGPATALRTEIHRLAGSAGSYGLEDIGCVALSLDRMLAAETEEGPELAAVGRLIGELERALEHAAP